ncbi:maf-like protein [Bartonella bacilliformis str. Heidi Mejia]|uniref:Maf family nucleotide pyrophosphatase n=1 Tax=Bartonella bacilliformis TaxID=774 RepID=UPI00044D4477|nr:Maf family nucleotide pyrophosphatase [Bartonella bacilliformis]EYS90817.1 maf-like protein [Bartonella bacilliformis str. Heidi Mejia]EYS95558.1 maf-like protein [Bartonella bacilliformis Peru-18]KEG17968.1 maf-like protein [Bartonella bacilliformis Cond044]KEG18365.1 maf-like protein [Bartonella bacilliformis CUSCO5]KEG20582.1 maf-like protein [Bartonella bacilliformis Hosp800-02]
MKKNTLILASRSFHRAQLLKNAGLNFSVEGASFDEREVEKKIGTKTPKELGRFLAIAKAKNVSDRFPNTLVIGCDQVLDLEGQVFHKVTNRKEAHQRLRSLSGKTHYLHSAVALVQNGQEIWSEVFSAHMTMRFLSSEFIERYLEHVGMDVLKSLGIYQIEGKGIHLFEKIEGDYFTIIGLPLLPLLAKLRHLGVIDG